MCGGGGGSGRVRGAGSFNIHCHNVISLTVFKLVIQVLPIPISDIIYLDFQLVISLNKI